MLRLLPPLLQKNNFHSRLTCPASLLAGFAASKDFALWRTLSPSPPSLGLSRN